MRTRTPIVLVLDRLAVELVAITNAAIASVGEGDLSFAQWRLLMVLGGAAEPLRLNVIAARISASMPSASRLVARMERRGFVTSSRDPIDGRGRRIVLTATGQAVRDRVVERRRASLAERLGSLSLEAAVTAGLTEIVEVLSNPE